MLHDCLNHEKERENICAKCLFELLLSDFLNGLLRMLFRGIVNKNIQPAELLYRLRDSFLAEFFLADIAFD